MQERERIRKLIARSVADPSRVARLEAALAEVHFGAAEAGLHSVVEAALAEGDHIVRLEAVSVIGRWPERNAWAVSTLETVQEHDEDASIRAVAGQMLRELEELSRRR